MSEVEHVEDPTDQPVPEPDADAPDHDIEPAPDAPPAPEPPAPEPSQTLSRVLAREAQLRRREAELAAREQRLGKLDVGKIAEALESGDAGAIARALGKDPAALYGDLTRSLVDPSDDPVNELRRQQADLAKQIAEQRQYLEQARAERAIDAERSRIASAVVPGLVSSAPILSAVVSSGLADHAGIAGDLYQIKAEEYHRTGRALDDAAASRILVGRLEQWLAASDRIRSALPRTKDPVAEAGADEGRRPKDPGIAPSRRSAGAATTPAPHGRKLSMEERLEMAREKLRGGRYQ